MFEFKNLSEVSLETALEVWNEGFKGYYVDLRMDYQAYVGRFYREDLLPEESIMLYKDGQPVGFTLNGYRTVQGEKMAWNGGTAVLPAFRGEGIGRRLLEENIKRYSKAAARIATLEAFVENKPAIALYEKFGYRGVGTTVFYDHPGEYSVGMEADPVSAEPGLILRETAVAEAAALPIYDYSGPWQTYWHSQKDGRCLIAEREGRILGYVQFRRVYSGAGELNGIHLYPGKLLEGIEDRSVVLSQLLTKVFHAAGEGVSRKAVHIPSSDTAIRSWLERAGFRYSRELLHMRREMA